MKKFDYKYSNILEIKRKNEDSVKNQLSLAIKTLKDEEEKLLDLKSNKSSCYESMGQQVINGASISHLRTYNSFLTRLNKRINVHNNIIDEQNSKIENIRKNLLNMTKEVRIFEKLKENYVEEYKYEELKEEERLTDQLVTYKSFVCK